MRLVDPLHIPVWGLSVTTPLVSSKFARVNTKVDVTNTSDMAKNIFVEVVIKDPEGALVEKKSKAISVGGGALRVASLNFKINKPQRWDVDTPRLYTVESRLLDGKVQRDMAQTSFGLRTFKWTADDGFHLNGRRVQLNGVNMHHDQGPLGAAFFPRAMERQLQIMQDMGVNALRTSHNAAAPEVLELCDRMGIIVFNELFDKYGPTAGVQCSTADFVNPYAEREIKNFVLRDRNHPSVCLWSIGNEISEILNDSDGKSAEHVAKMVKYFKKYDPTRPTTMGNHIPGGAKKEKHIFDKLDTSGWNYGQKYLVAKENYPDKPLIYSESGSVFGTRGAYKLTMPENKTDWGKDGYLSAYCLTSARWSDIPEHEFERMIQHSYVAGEFVWTGFDYLGEPTPFSRKYADSKGRLARSSYFGIVDLAGLPKDSYYLYRSHWNKKKHTVFLTPHWNWQEGDNVPVFLYTDGDEAELFLNGKSLGRRKKVDRATLESKNLYFNVVDVYRLRWMDVPYVPGEIKAVAYKKGVKIGVSIVQTAEKAAELRVTPDRFKMDADGMDLCYVTVEMLDEKGRVCPLAMDTLTFKVSGAARLAGVANGDQMGFDSFTDDTHSLFYGKAVAVLRSVPGKSGSATVEVVAEKGMKAKCAVKFGEF
jgi:beta-galactosidase